MVPELEPVFVELYLRCKTNPSFDLPGGREASRIFVVDMEKKLEQLNTLSRDVLMLRAEGCNRTQIAKTLRVSPHTVERRLREIDRLPRSWERSVA